MKEPRPAVAGKDHWLPETVIVTNPGPCTYACAQNTPAATRATSKGSDDQAGRRHVLLKSIHGLVQSSRYVYMGVLPLNLYIHLHNC